jgi:hypothetical protein
VREKAERITLGPSTAVGVVPSKPALSLDTGDTSAAQLAVAPVGSLSGAEPKTDLLDVQSTADVNSAASVAAITARFDGASLTLGGAGGLLIGALLFGVLGVRTDAIIQRWMFRGALFVAFGALIAVGYLGFVRKSAGLGGSALVTPRQIVDDARGAVEQVKQKRLEQEKQLEEIQRLAK